MQNPVVFGFETENYGVCVFFLEHGFVYAQTKLVSPFGRDVAQRQRGLAPSLRELACRLAARLREQPVICHASGKLLRRPVRVLLLPSRLAPCHLPQGGRLWFSAQSKLVSPFGRDVSQRQRELAPSLRELGCRLAARLREQPARPDESGELSYEFVSVLPSQSFASQMPALPKGEPRSWCEPQS